MDQVRSLQVRFEPSGRIVPVLPGTSLLTASERAGFRLPSICGGQGTCGKCKVRILQGTSSFTSLEQESLSSEERQQGIHLACQTLVHQNLTVEMLTEEQTEGTKFLTYGMPVEMELDDHLQKFYLDLPQPGLENQAADLETIEQAISSKGEKLKISLPLLQKLSNLLREQQFKITAVTANGQLLTVEKGDTTSRRFGLAVDLGTTTIVGVLVDMSTGRDLAISARTNPQVAHGADVISRIQFATREPDGLQRLQRLVIGSINEIIDELTHQAGVTHREIYEMALAGNTIMEHLFLGVNPEYIAMAPYVPTFKRSQIVPAAELGLNILPQATVWTVPNISGYVGGDITGLILAFELHRRDTLTLALDIGTNGEIVLGSRERLLCCSAAAGPAFEGGHISCGMRAMTGAIESVSFNGSDLFYQVIGGVAPQGICGTGLIDITSEMLKH
ncbi:MAG: ASKHA domain-containing protein, partial [candidate division KSB1 bacterium]|nr:ASKHA domain-containing protein [candidate division KSB1 bacterium]